MKTPTMKEMTMRDYIAVLIAQGHFADDSSWEANAFERVADRAYRMADALLKRRMQDQVI